MWCRNDLDDIRDVLSQQLAERGGIAGIRDAGALGNAAARRIGRANCGESTAARVAAACVCRLVGNRRFADGSKRTGRAPACLFSGEYGYRPDFEEEDAICAMEGLAGGLLRTSGALRGRDIMISALYAMRYLGSFGAGFATVYIGKGVIAGIDNSNVRYRGTYRERNGRVTADLALSAPAGSAMLVRGSRFALASLSR